MTQVLKGWKKIAAFLDVTTRTIQAWEAKGIHIPVWKIGHEVRIHEIELIRWMKKYRKTAAPKSAS